MQTFRAWNRNWRFLIAIAMWIASARYVGAADVILNEYNAVNSGRYLDGDDYSGVGGVAIDKEDSYFATVSGLSGDGRVQGNGGNWFELVVTGDHVDMRGWKLQWAETDKFVNDGTVVWYTPSAGQVPDQGVITLTDSAVWSDMRAGTIITMSRRTDFLVDTTLNGDNKNFNDFANPLGSDGTYEVEVDLSTNVSFNPAAGDWWINVSTRGEFAALQPLVTTVANTVDDLGMPDPPGSFSTGNDDWQLRILDAAGTIVFGPSGEVEWNEAVNSRQVGKLQADPSTTITANDTRYNQGTSSSFGQPNIWTVGTSTVTQNFEALRSWFTGAEPDADFDGDGDVDGADLAAWQRGVGATNATHAQGDANFNGAVNGDDLAVWRSGFGGGGTGGSTIPEPASAALGAVALAAAQIARRRARSVKSRQLQFVGNFCGGRTY